MIRSLQTFILGRMAFGAVALVLVALSAATLPPWPFVFAALAIGAALLVLILRPVQPTEFRRRFERKIKGVRPIRTRDGDFGLYYPWYFNLRVKEEAEQCRRYGFSMAVLVLKVLPLDRTDSIERPRPIRPSKAASETASTIRAMDLSTALGPLEFAVCLVHCDQAGADALIDRLREELGSYECMIGYATYPDGGSDVDALVDIARARALSFQPDKLNDKSAA